MIRNDVIIISAEGDQLSSGPLYVASLLLNHGYKVRTLQCLDQFAFDQINALLDKYFIDDVQILGVSTTFMRSEKSVNTISYVVQYLKNKFPNIRIVVGGTNNVVNKSIFPSDTHYMLGSSNENETIDLFNTLTGRIKKIPFDFLTFSIRYKDLFSATNPPKGLVMYLEISRGCIFDCAFCNYKERRTKSRYKSEEQIIKEITEFYTLFGSAEIILLCNTFNDDESKIMRLKDACEKLPFTPRFFAYTRIDLFMRQSQAIYEFYDSYVRYVFFGIESFSKDTLRAVNKKSDIDNIKTFLMDFRNRTLPLGTYVYISLILGLPNDSAEIMKENAIWLVENNVTDYVTINPLRLNNVKHETFGMTEYSNFEQDPKKYGYTVVGELLRQPSEISNHGINIRPTSFFEWIRDDGYTSEQAVVDTMLIQRHLKQGSNFITLMMANSMNLSDPVLYKKSPKNLLFHLGVVDPVLEQLMQNSKERKDAANYEAFIFKTFRHNYLVNLFQ